MDQYVSADLKFVKFIQRSTKEKKMLFLMKLKFQMEGQNRR